MSRKRSSDPDSGPPEKLLQLVCAAFEWETRCFICGETENIKKNRKLTQVSKTFSREKVLKAAMNLKQQSLYDRVETQTDLYGAKARYHKLCYQNMNPNRCSKDEECDKNDDNVLSLHQEIAKTVFSFYREDLEAGKIITLPTLCHLYREKLLEAGSETQNVQSSFIKSHLKKVFGDEFVFFSQNGKADIICSKNLSIENIVHNHLLNISCDSVGEEDDGSFIVTEDSLVSTEDQKLHEAACILRKYIKAIRATTDFPLPTEVCLEESEKFVPEPIRKFMTWVLDEKACKKADTRASSPTLFRRAITLSECIIYSSTTKNQHVIPPFHHGFMIGLYHDYGSRSLIEELNANGFCASYTELRSFLTSAAEVEMKKNEKIYVPSNVVPRNQGGNLIQEGDDNVDINVETIDGKNTYHSMARVIFQKQTPQTVLSIERIPRAHATSLDVHVFGSQFQLLPYQKPKQRPEPIRIQGLLAAVKTKLKDGLNLHLKDICWVMARNVGRGMFGADHIQKQIIPSWKLLNSNFSEKEELVTVPCYIPSINSQPSDISTVYTTLKKGEQLAIECGQSYHVHTFDQQLYAIAQQVKFANTSEFANLTVRLGGFHTLCCYISCINKIWGDCGISDLLVESGVYAKRSVENMLKGKEFHRVIRGLTLVYEVLLSFLIENFLNWLDKNDESTTYMNLRKQISDFHAQFSQKKFAKDALNKLSSDIQNLINKLFMQFREEGCARSPTFRFWDSCLQALQLMLLFIRAEREKNWDLHVDCIARMLPFFFCCDKPNYARYGTLYVSEMMCSLSPTILEEFRAGNFVVNFTCGAFNGLWSDMGVEMSVIKDNKGSGGVVGLTNKGNSLLRWSVTRNLTGMYSSHMRRRNGNSPSNDKVHERPNETIIDEKHFSLMREYAKNHMSDPYSDETRSDVLINISTGLIATDIVASSLLNALQNGEKQLYEFIETTLDQTPTKIKSFHDPIPKLNLKTFSSVTIKKSSMNRSKIHHEQISPELVYQRALAISSTCDDVSLEKILSYPLTDIPPIFFKADGSRRTTTKADLMHVLEKEVDGFILKERPQGDTSIVIIDGMALVQSLNNNGLQTFDDLAFRIMEGLIRRLSFATEVHVIFDRYDSASCSPKQDERYRRYGNESRTYDIKSGRSLPELKKLLANDDNKSALTEFICKYIQENLPNSPIMKNRDKRVVLAGGLKPRHCAFIITYQSAHSDMKFNCNHMEADTRIVFHVAQISSTIEVNNSRNIFVESPDTDVFVLLIAHYQLLEHEPLLWFHTGRVARLVDNRRFIPVNLIATRLGSQMARALPIVHAFTGCDTVSSIFNIGKKKLSLL